MIVADEPTGTLDSRSGQDVLDLPRDTVDQLGRTVVMVTHDATTASRADVVVQIADGQVVVKVADGEPTGDGWSWLRTGSWNMLLLGWNSVRHRFWALLGAFASLVLALTAVTACLVVMESAMRAGVPIERYAGADVVVAGADTLVLPNADPDSGPLEVPLPERARVPSDVVDRVAAVPGVRAVVADLAFPAVMLGGDGVPSTSQTGISLGHPASTAVVTPLVYRSGAAPQADDEVAVDTGTAERAGIRPGDRVRVLTAGNPNWYRLTGVVAPADGGSLTCQTVLLFPDQQARRLAGAAVGRDGAEVDPTALVVLREPGADTLRIARQIRQALAGRHLDVVTGDARGRAELAALAVENQDTIAGTGNLVGLVLMVALSLVAGTFAVSLQQRHREIALLRAVGTTTGQVRGLVAIEVLILTLGAAVIGGPVGGWSAGRFLRALVAHDLAPVSLRLYLGPLSFAGAIVLTLLMGQIAALVAGRRAAGIQPVQALQEASVPPPRLGRRRLVVGVAFLLVAAGMLACMTLIPLARMAAPNLAFAANWALTLAAVMLAPAATRAGLRLLGGPIGRLSPRAGFLAVATARTDPRRVAAAVVPLQVALLLACGVLFIPVVSDHGAAMLDERRLRADRVLASSGSGIADEALTQARRLPGIDAAVGVSPTTLIFAKTLLAERDASGVDVVAVSAGPGELPQVLDLGTRSGSVAELTGQAVALSEDMAAYLGVRVGDEVTLWLGDGTQVSARVAATYQRSLGFGEAVVPRSLVAEHIAIPMSEQVLLHCPREPMPPRSTVPWPDSLRATPPCWSPTAKPPRLPGRPAAPTPG